MDRADAYFEILLKEYKQLKKQQENELAALPEGHLRIRKEKNNINYVQCLKGDSKRVRKGITRNRELVEALARKRYLQISLSLLEKDIPVLEKLVAKHTAPTAQNVLCRIPKNLQSLPIEMYLPQFYNRAAWAKETFEQSNNMPEGKTHITDRGLKVRSKSEVIIANKLDVYQVPYRYEQILYIENRSFSPDFTIMTPKGLVYWEHCGLVSDKFYMKNHKWKISMYEKAGIVPWENLIITYDNEEGNLDSRIIESEIVNKLCNYDSVNLS